MSESEHTLKNSKRHWLLDSSIPDITYPSAQLIRQVNMSFRIPYGYTGVALLSPEGQVYANNLKEIAGRCLGGGVLSSRDLEWLANGRNGIKPGDYVPTKSLFGSSKNPQSVLPSEWIAFEYGLLLTAPFGSPMVSSWDEVLSVAKVRSQGRDFHVRIDGHFGEPGQTIFAQANKNGMNTLMKICEIAGVPVYR
jgi:hypothetical protein